MAFSLSSEQLRQAAHTPPLQAIKMRHSLQSLRNPEQANVGSRPAPPLSAPGLLSPAPLPPRLPPAPYCLPPQPVLASCASATHRATTTPLESQVTPCHSTQGMA